MYVKVIDLKAGQWVGWWTQAVKVIKTCRKGNEIEVTVFDKVTNKEQTFSYGENEELRLVSGSP